MSTTLIARRTRVTGRIETHGDVMVEGRIEGSIVAGGCVTVGVSGVAVSDIHTGRAVVLGIVIGNIEASERIDVAASARIVGDVRSPLVSVASPATIEGRVDELETGAPPVSPSGSHPTGPAPQAVVASGQVSTSGTIPTTRPTLKIRGAAMVRPAPPDAGTDLTPLEPGRSTRATAELPRPTAPVARPSAPVNRAPHVPVPPRPPGRSRMLPRQAHRPGDDES